MAQERTGPWSPEELDRLRRLAVRGVGLTGLVKALHRSRRAVSAAAKLEGIVVAEGWVSRAPPAVVVDEPPAEPIKRPRGRPRKDPSAPRKQQKTARKVAARPVRPAAKPVPPPPSPPPPPAPEVRIEDYWQPGQPKPITSLFSAITPEVLARVARRDPALAQAVEKGIAIEAMEEERRSCEGSLIAFMMRAWRELESRDFELNWHHEVIGDYLESVARGVMRRLVINVPPRHTKTLLVSVIFPAWIWAQPPENYGPLSGPHVKFLCVSYGSILSEEIATKMRRLVMGEWYQRLWGHRVSILPDQKSRANFANAAGGERMSTSIEGGILGRGGDIIIIDDPQTRRGADSDAERRESITAMSDLTTRITDPRISAQVLIMQRLHVADATDWALKNWSDDTVHLRFPARYIEAQPCEGDIRTVDGELLWPDVWTEEELTKIERGLAGIDGEMLTDYAISGQLQQSPVPRGGGIIKNIWWKLWPDDAEQEMGAQTRFRCEFCKWQVHRHYFGETQIECERCGMTAERVIEFPATSFRVLSVDTGIGDKEMNSYSAATLWGVWHGRDEAPRLMLMEAWRGRPMLRGGTTGEKGLVEVIASMANRRLVDTVLIERKTRGVDLYNELDRMMREYPWSLEFFEPTGRGDKVARLASTQPLFTNDLIWAPKKGWADLVINEVSDQPRAQFSDLTDTASAALLWLRDTGRLSMSHEHEAEQRRSRIFVGRSQRANIAEMYEGA